MRGSQLYTALFFPSLEFFSTGFFFSKESIPHRWHRGYKGHETMYIKQAAVKTACNLDKLTTKPGMNQKDILLLVA
ncbi:hypothetical protein LXL04_001409 [Taraxacum kok-saghyz]